MKTSGTVVIKQPKTLPEGQQKETQKLKQLAKKSETIIFQTASVFPFKLFPDKLIMDATKLTLVHSGLFYKHVYPVLYSDLLSVKVTRGMFFASLSFEVRGFEENPTPITFLWPDQAGKAERRIMGLLSAKRELIETSKIPTEKLEKEIKKIGSSGAGPEKLL